MTLPFQEKALLRASRILKGASGNAEARFLILETCAELLAELPGTITRQRPTEQQIQTARDIIAAVSATQVPAAMALAILAREDLDDIAQRRQGVFYTDYRLANRLTEGVEPNSDPILDPACGTGILLIAAALKRRGTPGFDKWLGNNIHGSDLSATALRGARLALASLAQTAVAVEGLSKHLVIRDALHEPPAAIYGTILSNPPWEKLKLTRHEHALAHGKHRHYGASFAESPDDKFNQAVQETRRRAKLLRERYALAGTKETDLYALFLAMAARAIKPGGSLRFILPAGLIRAQGTSHLRNEILSQFSNVAIDVLHNREAYFDIDSRFKFILLTGKGHRAGPARSMKLNVVAPGASPVEMSIPKLRDIRPDLTVPEVRSPREWQLFLRLSQTGMPMRDHRCIWKPRYQREVDMTRDRRKFRETAGHDCLPLIEGRMVNQFTAMAKSYSSGQGRAATWTNNPWIGTKYCRPQFHIAIEDLTRAARERAGQARIGFADITGQTNERSMMAALIPPDVACGNKVPTIIFESEDEKLRDAWLGVANSLAFDWLLRRTVTTTVNYFVLDAVPLPQLDPDAQKAVASMSRQVARVQHSKSGDHWQYATMRAELDAYILKAYGASEADTHTILADFPLIDQRGRRSITGNVLEPTKDLILEAMGIDDSTRAQRLVEARRLGIQPYVPAEFSSKTLKQRPPQVGDLTRSAQGSNNIQLRKVNAEG